MRKILCFVACALILSATSSNSKAAIIDIPLDLTGVEFNDVLGSVLNDSLVVDFGPGTSYHIIGIGWDIDIEAFSPSWRSEAVMAFKNGDTNVDQLFLTVGSADGSPGVGFYSSSGVVDLIGLGFDWTQTSNLMDIEFFDSFDDGFSPQAVVLGGGITVRVDVTAVPEPSSVAFLSLGLFGAFIRRRSR